MSEEKITTETNKDEKPVKTRSKNTAKSNTKTRKKTVATKPKASEIEEPVALKMEETKVDELSPETHANNDEYEVYDIDSFKNEVLSKLDLPEPESEPILNETSSSENSNGKEHIANGSQQKTTVKDKIIQAVKQAENYKIFFRNQVVLDTAREETRPQFGEDRVLIGNIYYPYANLTIKTE